MGLHRVLVGFLLTFAMGGSTAACADQERPPATGTSEIQTSMSSVSAEDDDEEDTYVSYRICTAGETRPCTISYTDDLGSLHCFDSKQSCREDGYSWNRCGDAK